MSSNSQQYRPLMGTPAGQPTAVTWSVLGQTEVVQPTPQGRLASGVKVTFQLSTGEISSVFVLDPDYTADNVRAAIQARVAQIVAVGGLSGTGSAV